MSAGTLLGKHLRRYVCLGLIVTLAPLSLSCYGHFPLTKAVYRTNGNIGRSVGEDATGHRLIQSVVMWIMIIVPVYEVCMIGDVLVTNLIEFWSGNVVQIGSVEERNGVRMALQPSADGREVMLTVSRNGKLLSEQRFIKTGANAFEIRDASGKLSGKVTRTDAGGIALADARGRIIRTLTATDLATLRAH